MGDYLALFDLAVAWEWAFDADFIDLLLCHAARQGWSVLTITHDNLEVTLQDLAAARLRVRCLLDRASDAWPAFARLAPLIEHGGGRIINPARYELRACDKARTHLLCAAHGVPLPYTTIVPPFCSDPSPPLIPAGLGRPFVAKPASGGGGQGVLLDVSTVPDVQNARRMFWHDRYLLQQKVRPGTLDGRRAWFRVFYTCGRVIPCWWDDLSHLYALLTPEEEARFGLSPLREIVPRIARTVALDFFSAEIALADDGRLVCVDYANSPCDLRLQSHHPDGVPDAVVERIIEGLFACVPPRYERPPVWRQTFAQQVG